MERKKQINTTEFGLVIKHAKLIENARKRGYSAKAISKLVLAAEASRKVGR